MRTIGSTIDILIPLAIGIFMIFSAKKAVKNDDPQYDKKVRRLKSCGYLFIGICFVRLVWQLFK